jgi:DHA2 family multidrug resistance protein
MAAGGSGPVLANQQTYQTLFGMVSRQSAMLAFIEVFHLLSLMFLLLIPLILVMKRPAKGAAAEMAH